MSTMRGSKRRASLVATTAAGAAKPSASPSAVPDAILDVVNRKGIRYCVECGATSTPQWREGPMGPKTLCNACGVRRQRLLRKQQAAVVGVVPTAPVAAVQARRRLSTRTAAQAPGMNAHDVQFGSGSEQSSDEAELNWHTLQQHLPQHLLHSDVEDSCNEEETAAYDLLFFAGIDCGSGGGTAVPVEPSFGGPQPLHGHNTRRTGAPLRRSDDFFYYYQDSLLPAEVEGGSSSIKRRKVAAAPPRMHLRNVLPGGSLSSSTGGTTDSNMTAFRAPSSAAASASLPSLPEAVPTPAVSDLLRSLQEQPSNVPQNPHAVPPAGPSNSASSAATDVAAVPVAPAPVLAALAPLLTMPAGLQLPAVPLSLSLPLALGSVTPQDLEVLAHLHAEFQRACLQLANANAAAEAVGTVVAERREAAADAHALAAAASQQLADGARTVADRHQLLDVLAELHAGVPAPQR